MATAASIPVELYLRTSYEPDADYVDGEVELRPSGEYDHATWQQAIQKWFMQRDKEWRIRVRPELRVQVGHTRYRVPDVVVFDRKLPVEQILTHPPIAVFEVLSPEDSMTRILRKLSDYEAMGVQTILVIDPKTERFYQFEKGSLDLCPDPVIQLAGSDASIDWNAVKELLD